MKKIIIIILMLFYVSAQAQLPPCTFTHYSPEEGLPQKIVMHILEDRDGMMWFSTWNGLSKFDGYNFTNYKPVADSGINITNNRIDFFEQDKYGFLWVRTYNNSIYRFDIQKETFESVSQAETVRNLKILPNGHVWLLFKNGDVTCVLTNEKNFSLTTENKLRVKNAANVNDVFLDSGNCEWLLTDNGISLIDANNTTTETFFDNGKNNFLSAAESGQFIAFGGKQGLLQIYDKKNQKFESFNIEIKSDIIALKPLNKSNLLVAATNADGFFIIDLLEKRQTHYNMQNCKALQSNKIRDIYVDKYDEIWINQAVEAAVVHFNAETKIAKLEQMQVEPISAISSRPPFQIVEDINGYLWVHPFGGGFAFYDRSKDALIPFYNKIGSNDWRFSSKVHSMASDRQGNLWMCTHSKGLEKITFHKNLFHTLRPTNLNYESLSNDVRSIFAETDKNRLWIGTREGTILIYDIKLRNFLGYFSRSGAISQTKTDDGRITAYNIIKDSSGRIWIATRGDGIMKLENENNGRFQVTSYKNDYLDLFSLSDNNVYCMHEDKNRRIWLATFGGGVNYIQEDADGKTVFINYRNKLKCFSDEKYYKVRTITSDGSGNIWVGTTNGALCFDADFANPENIEISHYLNNANNAESISDNDVYGIIRTSENQMFFATFGGGLNKLVSRAKNGDAKFKSYTTKNGFPSNLLLAVEEDKDKNLWISSENGLMKFNPTTELSEIYDNSHFDFKAGFNEGADAKVGDLMLFGSSNGLLSFTPDSIRKSDYVPPIVLSKLRVLQKEIMPSQKKSILSQSLNGTHKITLSRKQNIFSIQYAALDMKCPEKIKYAYKLEGFEREWNYVDGLRTAIYTNIPKGEYIFKVKSTNADGVWADNERALNIVIKPSFWERPIAYLLYVLLFFLLVFATVYTILIFYRLKQKVQMEKEISDLKLRFFTNISHELRTPLTLIAGPVEQVLENPSLPQDQREQLSIVKRNSDRMLHLVNQILDFRKVQNKKMKLRVQKIEVVSFTRRVMDNFNQIAVEHQIDYVFEPEKPELYLWADADKLETIIFNLLSNAFKYTPSGKMISVFVAEDEHTISIGVQDQGVGISDKEKKSLFVRFENLIEKNIFSNSSSTGIGLSLVKEFTEMHKATIKVESALGKGSLFAVNFIKGKEHYDESVDFILNDYPQDKPENIEPALDAETVDAEDNKPLMLLVEDNAELRSFLRTIFCQKFRIIEAGDGQEGITKALHFIPDFIITDVIMPRKDGIEMMKELRANLSTSHIPIIVLTAKSDIDDKLEVLGTGADSYITKPFSSAYLQARVDNIIARRKNLQNIYRDALSAAPAEPETETETKQQKNVTAPTDEQKNEISPNDRKFMNNLMELMELNIDNGELMVEELARELAVSRSVFFKKLKALTGLAPIEFIREIRIKRAAQLIETEDLTMTEIADKVGINDSRYFSKCFKHQFGVTPTEYRDKMKNEK